STKDRRRNAEDDVVLLNRQGKTGLRQRGRAVAGAGVGSPSDGEQIFHSADDHVGVDRAVRVKAEREAGFTSWAIGRDEGRHGVAGGDAVAGEKELRIGRSAAPAKRWLRMTGAATIRVEARAQADVGGVGHRFYFLEASETVVEKRSEAVWVV